MERALHLAARMSRRALAGLVLLLVSSLSRASDAAGVLSAGGHAVHEIRTAVAVGGAQTTLWVQLVVSAPGSGFAVLVPAPPGARLARTSDAWLEALASATAPRVLAPSHARVGCPGETGVAFALAESVGHAPTLAPAEVAVLADATALEGWASDRGFVVDAAVAQGMVAGEAILAARFAAGGGGGMSRTATLRVAVSSAGAPLLQRALGLARAGAEPVALTSFVLGAGRAALAGTSEIALPPDALVLDAAAATSNYATARAQALAAAGPAAALFEASSHDALAHAVAVPSGGPHVAPVVKEYFSRAALYGDAAADATGCIAKTQPLLDAAAPVAAACARAELGTVGASDCLETVGPAAIDPDALRCGELCDDLAVALGSQTPGLAWVTRHALRLAPDASAPSASPTTVPWPEKDVFSDAASVDESGCAGSAGGGSSSASAGGGASGGVGPSETDRREKVYVPVYEVETGCTAQDVGAVLYWEELWVGDDETAPDAYYYDEQESCTGETTSSYEPVYGVDEGAVQAPDPDGEPIVVAPVADDGGESGDASGSAEAECGGETSDTSAGQDCGGDTSEPGGDDCSGDASEGGDDCSRDASEGADDCGGGSEGASDGCSGDGAPSDGCGKGGGDKCAVDGERRSARRRGPRLSQIVLGLAALLAPLRRGLRRRRRVA
jgi:hypothetical protein